MQPAEESKAAPIENAPSGEAAAPTAENGHGFLVDVEAMPVNEAIPIAKAPRKEDAAIAEKSEKVKSPGKQQGGKAPEKKPSGSGRKKP